MIALRMYLHIGMVCGSDGLGSGWWDIKVVKKRYDGDSMTSEKMVVELYGGQCQ